MWKFCEPYVKQSVSLWTRGHEHLIISTERKHHLLLIMNIVWCWCFYWDAMNLLNFGDHADYFFLWSCNHCAQNTLWALKRCRITPRSGLYMTRSQYKWLDLLISLRRSGFTKPKVAGSNPKKAVQQPLCVLELQWSLMLKLHIKTIYAYIDIFQIIFHKLWEMFNNNGV